MMDPSLLGAQLPMAGTQNLPQTLPNAAQQADVDRFQSMLASGIGDDSSMQPTTLDSPILQRVDTTQPSDGGGLQNALIDRASQMDASYHSIMDQLRNRPGLSDYMESGADPTSQPLRTYPEVSSMSEGGDYESRLKNMVDSMSENNTATMEFQRDMTAWSMNFQMWSSGVELVSSMVSQVSKGFQTLFRASG